MHPDKEEFQFKGRDLEFQKMACGKDPYEEEIHQGGVQMMYTCYTVISISRQALDRVGALSDDYIYTNYDDDTDEGDSDDDDFIE